MTDAYRLAERVRGKLAQEGSHNDPDLRRVLGHAKLLDSLFIELSVSGLTWNEHTVSDEDLMEYAEDGSDSDSQSDTDSSTDSDYNFDSESDSDSDSDSESDPDSDPEWCHCEDLDQETRNGHGSISARAAKHGWAEIEESEDTANPAVLKPIIQISSQQVREEPKTSRGGFWSRCRERTRQHFLGAND